MALRLSPRDPQEHVVFGLLAFACFGARRYPEGADWASRAIGNRPRMIQIHDVYAGCLVGMGEIDRARAVFDRLRKLAPDYAQQGLDGTSLFARAEDRLRARTFLRIAAGLEDASAADALRVAS
jgi:adenylate cyclase